MEPETESNIESGPRPGHFSSKVQWPQEDIRSFVEETELILSKALESNFAVSNTDLLARLQRFTQHQSLRQVCERKVMLELKNILKSQSRIDIHACGGPLDQPMSPSEEDFIKTNFLPVIIRWDESTSMTARLKLPIRDQSSLILLQQLLVHCGASNRSSQHSAQVAETAHPGGLSAAQFSTDFNVAQTRILEGITRVLAPRESLGHVTGIGLLVTLQSLRVSTASTSSPPRSARGSR